MTTKTVGIAEIDWFHVASSFQGIRPESAVLVGAWPDAVGPYRDTLRDAVTTLEDGTLHSVISADGGTMPAPGARLARNTLNVLKLGEPAYAVMVGTAPDKPDKPDAPSKGEDLALKPGQRLRPEPYVRPNGEAYGPRRIEELNVYDVQLIESAYAERIPVLLYGPPGTGKTALVDSVLSNVITVPGSADTEVADFLGSYVQNPDGTFSWVDGPLLKAMEEGRPLFIDEVPMIDPRVMSIVYSTMDGRGELHVTVNPARGTVKAKDGFYVIAAGNPDVPGAVMSEALLSRFAIQLEVLTDYGLAKRLGAPPEIVVLARNLARKRSANEIMRAPQMREILQYAKFERRFGRKFALANLISCSDPADREVVGKVIAEVFGSKTTALMVGE